MITVVMLLGMAVMTAAMALVGFAAHSIIATSQFSTYQEAVQTADSALNAFYAQLEVDPQFFDSNASWPPTTDGNDGWYSFDGNGQVAPCPSGSGLAAPGAPGCWQFSVSASSQPSQAGDNLSGSQQVATATVLLQMDCHGTVASCLTVQAVQRYQLRDFADFLNFTESQQVDPSFASPALCDDWIGCSIPVYDSGDVVRGPLYVNGALYICDNPQNSPPGPQFDGPIWITAKTNAIEAPPGTPVCLQDPTLSNSSNQVLTGQPVLPLPDNTAQLQALAAAGGQPWPGQDGYAFNGSLDIAVNGNSMDISLDNGPVQRDVSFPTTGVVYASGDIAISGQVQGKVTFVSAGNITIDGDLTYACDPSGRPPIPSGCTDMTGLEASGSIWLDFADKPLTVDAAMVALSHSVSINPQDLTACNNACPQLTIVGAIISYYRGVYGAYNVNPQVQNLKAFYSNQVLMGWVKNFYYDNRLLHSSPPWLVSGQTGEWAAFPPVVEGAQS